VEYLTQLINYEQTTIANAKKKGIPLTHPDIQTYLAQLRQLIITTQQTLLANTKQQSTSFRHHSSSHGDRVRDSERDRQPVKLEPPGGEMFGKRNADSIFAAKRWEDKVRVLMHWLSEPYLPAEDADLCANCVQNCLASIVVVGFVGLSRGRKVQRSKQGRLRSDLYRQLKKFQTPNAQAKVRHIADHNHSYIARMMDGEDTPRQNFEGLIRWLRGPMTRFDADFLHELLTLPPFHHEVVQLSTLEPGSDPVRLGQVLRENFEKFHVVQVQNLMNTPIPIPPAKNQVFRNPYTGTKVPPIITPPTSALTPALKPPMLKPTPYKPARAWQPQATHQEAKIKLPVLPLTRKIPMPPLGIAIPKEQGVQTMFQPKKRPPAQVSSLMEWLKRKDRSLEALNQLHQIVLIANVDREPANIEAMCTPNYIQTLVAFVPPKKCPKPLQQIGAQALIVITSLTTAAARVDELRAILLKCEVLNVLIETVDSTHEEFSFIALVGVAALGLKNAQEVQMCLELQLVRRITGYIDRLVVMLKPDAGSKPPEDGVIPFPTAIGFIRQGVWVLTRILRILVDQNNATYWKKISDEQKSDKSGLFETAEAILRALERTLILEFTPLTVDVLAALKAALCLPSYIRPKVKSEPYSDTGLRNVELLLKVVPSGNLVSVLKNPATISRINAVDLLIKIIKIDPKAATGFVKNGVIVFLRDVASSPETLLARSDMDEALASLIRAAAFLAYAMSCIEPSPFAATDTTLLLNVLVSLLACVDMDARQYAVLALDKYIMGPNSDAKLDPDSAKKREGEQKRKANHVAKHEEAAHCIATILTSLDTEAQLAAGNLIVHIFNTEQKLAVKWLKYSGLLDRVRLVLVHPNHKVRFIGLRIMKALLKRVQKAPKSTVAPQHNPENVLVIPPSPETSRPLVDDFFATRIFYNLIAIRYVDGEVFSDRPGGWESKQFHDGVIRLMSQVSNDKQREDIRRWQEAHISRVSAKDIKTESDFEGLLHLVCTVPRRTTYGVKQEQSLVLAKASNIHFAKILLQIAQKENPGTDNRNMFVKAIGDPNKLILLSDAVNEYLQNDPDCTVGMLLLEAICHSVSHDLFAVNGMEPKLVEFFLVVLKTQSKNLGVQILVFWALGQLAQASPDREDLFGDYIVRRLLRYLDHLTASVETRLAGTVDVTAVQVGRPEDEALAQGSELLRLLMFECRPSLRMAAPCLCSLLSQTKASVLASGIRALDHLIFQVSQWLETGAVDRDLCKEIIASIAGYNVEENLALHLRRQEMEVAVAAVSTCSSILICATKLMEGTRQITGSGSLEDIAGLVSSLVDNTLSSAQPWDPLLVLGDVDGIGQRACVSYLYHIPRIPRRDGRLKSKLINWLFTANRTLTVLAEIQYLSRENIVKRQVQWILREASLGATPSLIRQGRRFGYPNAEKLMNDHLEDPSIRKFWSRISQHKNNLIVGDVNFELATYMARSLPPPSSPHRDELSGRGNRGRQQLQRNIAPVAPNFSTSTYQSWKDLLRVLPNVGLSERINMLKLRKTNVFYDLDPVQLHKVISAAAKKPDRIIWPLPSQGLRQPSSLALFSLLKDFLSRSRSVLAPTGEILILFKSSAIRNHSEPLKLAREANYRVKMDDHPLAGCLTWKGYTPSSLEGKPILGSKLKLAVFKPITRPSF